MDVSQDSPIVIHSDDDDDDDDDVVLIKAEEAPENLDKKDEDDVIFISEEPSTSVKKPDTKSKRKGARKSSSSSASDEDYSCTIPQLKYFQSEFSAVSLVDDILRPLDLSQGIIQTSEVLPTVIPHKLTILKPVQAACTSEASPEESSPGKAAGEDIEINPVKIVHEFDLTTGKTVDNASFAGQASKLERFSLLKLPKGSEILPSQTLNTPICKVDSGKECFSLCLQNSKDKTVSISALQDTSSSSTQTNPDKVPMKEKQGVSSSFCEGNDKWGGHQGKMTVDSFIDSTSLIQDVNMNSPCDDQVQSYTSDLLTALPTSTGRLDKAVTVILNQALAAPDDLNTGNTCTSPLMSSNGYINDMSSRPGSSRQSSSSLGNPLVSQPHSGTVKLHVPKTIGTSINGDITLDFDNLNTEDNNILSNLLDFFSDDGDIVDSAVSNKRSEESDEPSKGENKSAELTCVSQVSSIDGQSSSIAGQPSSFTGQSSSSTRQFSSFTGQFSSNISQDHLTKPYQQSLDCTDTIDKSLSNSQLRISIDLTDCNVKSDKSSTPSGLSSSKKIHARTLHKRLTANRHCYAFVIRDRKKIPSPHSKSLSSSHIALSASTRAFLGRHNCDRYHLAFRRKYSFNQGKRDKCNILMRKIWSDPNITSASGKSDASVKQTDPVQWQVVSLESDKKKCRARVSSISNQLPEAKRRKLLGESATEKPCLKMRLKLSTVVSGPMSQPATPAQSETSCIGLKKSIMRRHTSMTSATLTKEAQQHASMHRSVSENDLKKKQEAEREDQMCVTCEKTVMSKTISKCSKGHGVCTTCLEIQVKAILTGDVKQKNIRCPAKACIEILSFDELKKALPPFVVDILEEKLDKEYISYITKWMFTNELLKTRSEFATSDSRMPPCPALNMRKYEEIYTQESRDPTEDLPTFWAPMEHGAPVMVFEVVPDTEEYRALAIQFYETLNFGDFDIVRIIRVQNPILWKYFALKRSEMVQENDGMDVTEKQLYHGTHRSTLEAIARKGFDWRLSGKHGTIYGCGSYFAKTSRYSHGYTDRAGNGISVKAGGSGLGRIIQPSLNLTSLGMGFSASSTSNFFSRMHTIFNLPQPMPIPPMITSQNQPPQPPPAHYHLPAPPPAHGQMSSLQVPAHNQTSNPVSNKVNTTGGSAAASCGPSASEMPFVKTLSVASPSSSLPSSPGAPSARTVYIQPKFTTSTNFLKPPKTLTSGLMDFQPIFRAPITAVNLQLSAASLCSSQTASPFQAQLSCSGSRNSNYTSTNVSVSKQGALPTYSMVMGDIYGYNSSNSNQGQTKLGTSGSSRSSSGGSTGIKGQSESKQAVAPTPTKVRTNEKGTTDLTGAFARDQSSETHFMFVARVLVGRHTGGKAGLKRPPPLDELNPFGKSYDSCVDDIFCPQVFVIFDSNQAYPEYVIEYNWHKD